LSEAYDGEIRFVEHYVGRVLDLLRDRGVLDETVVVLTADHGEPGATRLFVRRTDEGSPS
jgi:arylsulfatase A-like enzyme